MLDRYAKSIETLSNIGILTVAILGAAVLGKSLVIRTPERGSIPGVSRPSSSPPVEAPAGAKIALPGVDWNGGEQTLVLVLSTTCRYCTNSAEFYTRLVRASRRTGKTRLVAVFPQTAEEGKQYLAKLGLRIDDVMQATPADVGTRGTPTLLLVDRSGTVTHRWAGQLPADREVEVLGYL